MRILFKAAIIASTCFTQATAQENCREIGTDLDRLACYDKENGRTSEIKPITGTGKWRVRTEVSEMTDQTSVFANLDANEPLTCGVLGRPNTPTLVVRCSENTTAVYIVTDCHLASSDYNSYGDVTYRIDDLESRTKKFDESTNNQSLGLWRGSKAIPFIKEMLGHNTMLTRFTPYGENSVTPRFDIAGIDQVVEPLREACGW